MSLFICSLCAHQVHGQNRTFLALLTTFLVLHSPTFLERKLMKEYARDWARHAQQKEPTLQAKLILSTCQHL